MSVPFSFYRDPTWSLYFPQAHLLEVDYLKKEHTLELIGLAGLEYPGEVKEEIFRLKQHGYIIKGENGKYWMRVPIFAQWVKQFAEVI